ncbi:hypothetical protein CURE108131_23045 [Cupriavidus respiraculi]|uniref:Ead/Ea22-like family protein n=1 Tax=Cupriavidus respiraculi TaxID=195930 RepID=A0ABM8WY44_9BURK|nr:hypothetical protein [Cupriavidus respiraculi]CAG9172474.1 hypothetical protein LMG21510_01986 [Cupriavidus respiraculi]
MNTTFSEAGLARVLEAVKKEPGHTPGPWTARYHRRYRQWNLFDSTGCGEAIAIVENVACTRSDEEVAANARLIAAAPCVTDQLAKQIELHCCALRLLKCDEEFIERQVADARAAIAKATGEQS